MKLIDLLVKELPKCGGWPEGVEAMAQDVDGAVQNYKDTKRIKIDESFARGKSRIIGSYAIGGDKIPCASDRLTAIVTRSQYESALAASEGWIEWAGGECPVDVYALVDFKLRSGVIITKRKAYLINWRYSDGQIIAYRLHKPDLNSRAKDDRLEQDLNECTGQDVDMPEWSGEGLPPVGTVCMANLGNGWTDVKVAYIGDEGGWREALVFEIKSTKPAWADEFRPLRTEAEKAREDAETAMRTCLAGTGAGITPLAAKGIYEAIAAGKIPGVKLEVK